MSNYMLVVLANPIKNRGGTVLNGGNVDTVNGVVTKNLGIDAVGYHSGTHGAVVPGPATRGDTTDTRAVQAINGSGTHAKMAAGSYVMRLVSTTLAGVANTALLSPASNSVARQSIRKRESYRTITYGVWNMVTGQPASKTTHLLGFHSISAGALALTNVDNAAAPTRLVPGELTYLATGQVPTNADYREKTG